MKVIEMIEKKSTNLRDNRQPVIAFAGDSVTQGCFEAYVKDGGVVETVFNAADGYVEKVKGILSMFFPACNITIVNAGISGNTAENGYRRLKEDVLSFSPNLTVVCYGLNDSHRRQEGLDTYKQSLKSIFDSLKSANSEIIFMTPNMCADYVHCSITEKPIALAADQMAKVVNEGWLDTYIEAAKQICKEEQVPICDCYALWKILYKNGVDMPNLLSNKINHPTERMHWLFAYELVKMMFM